MATAVVVLGSGKAQQEEARRNGATSAGELGAEGRLEQAAAAAAAAAAEGATPEAPPDSGVATPRPSAAATTIPAPASGVECGSDGATPSAASGADFAVSRSAETSSSPVLSRRPVAQATPPGNGGQQPRRHRPRSSERPITGEEEQQPTRSGDRGFDGRAADDAVGISADDMASGANPSTRVGGVSATTSTSAADAASCAPVGGADSGGGGVSSSSLQAVPAGMVPTVTCKVLVVGNAKCGKSSIISRFVNNRFSSDYRSTVGADYAMKDVALQGGRQVCVRCVCVCAPRL